MYFMGWFVGWARVAHSGTPSGRPGHADFDRSSTNFERPAIHRLAHRSTYDVIHRDLKPANALFREAPSGAGADSTLPCEPKITDFGRAKVSHEYGADEPSVTPSGGFLGTPSSTAPEQARGDAELRGPQSLRSGRGSNDLEAGSARGAGPASPSSPNRRDPCALALGSAMRMAVSCAARSLALPAASPDRMKRRASLLALPFAVVVACTQTGTRLADDGSVLPFPAEPMSSSVAEPRLQDSTMKWPEVPQRLPKDAPNILVILLDDVGFGISEVFGGEVHTPAFKKLADEGLRYNQFHTTSICSPTRAALLTGRNHTRVGNGTIAERAIAFDGFTGVIPMEAATVAEVLKQYGYKTSAFGKWHNTPATETTAMGPFDRWPTGYGFEHFWGFLAGETSQWEPALTENEKHIEPPHTGNFHLTEGMADEAIRWLDDREAFAPDKPFFMYWAPGGVHGPHHVGKEWADKYKGRFDDGWDAYRERVFQRQLEMGIIPAGTKLTPRDPSMPGWDSVPEAERPFQRRLMEVFAGFVEHTDAQVMRLVDDLERRGIRDDTLIVYIFGDNGSSAEGVAGTISELLAQNLLPNTFEQQITALNELGGLDALGSPKVDNMYNAGWAWAGGTPFKGTKLTASYFGGTRNPMVISWPNGIRPSKTMRSQFAHVVDIAPTIYEVLGITPPRVVNGHEQMQFDGTSFAYTFAAPSAPLRKHEQFFDNNGSRGIYVDGWFACTFGPLRPWRPAEAGKELAGWDSAEDVWELYDLHDDFSQANDLSQQNPGKLAELKARFLEVAEENKDFPIGGAVWTRLHPESVISSPYRSWNFPPTTRRMPEFAAPGLGKKSNTVTIDLEVGANAGGVLYALGGAAGGLTCYLDDGYIVYEYNLFIIERYVAQSKERLTAGKHTIVVETTLAKPGAPLTAVIQVDGKEVAKVTTKRSVPAAFSASESFDVGIDMGSPVSREYFDRAPFELDGHIAEVRVALKP
jgi:arylsulfatase